ncbi:hypothetical protein ACWEKT_34520 [Nocardia takedensis]
MSIEIEAPPLDTPSKLCTAMSQVAQQYAYLEHREPNHDLTSLDSQYGNTDVPDPLLTAHFLGRYYLLGASTLVGSLGKLLAFDQPVAVATGVLARAAAEYAGRAHFMTVLDDTPEMRIAKMAKLMSDGLQEFGVNGSDADPGEIALAQQINRWRSSVTLPRVKVPNYTNSVNQVSPDLGPREYPLLNRLVHANAVTLTVVTIADQANHYQRIIDAWSHALFATWCTLKATANACLLRDGDKSSFNTMWGAYDRAETRYNQYLWDLSKAQGHAPDVPRP